MNRRIAAATRGTYLPWLLTAHEKSHGNADLVAHFYRRAFDLLRRDGAFGLIATLIWLYLEILRLLGKVRS